MKHKAPQYTMILSGSGFRDNHTRGDDRAFYERKNCGWFTTLDFA